MCECDESLVARLEHDFKTTLQQQNTLEQWAAWLEGVVHTVLEPYEGGGHKFTKAARQFLLKWSFYRYRQCHVVKMVYRTTRDFICVHVHG